MPISEQQKVASGAPQGAALHFNILIQDLDGKLKTKFVGDTKLGKAASTFEDSITISRDLDKWEK